jgi:5-methylcytosine-specific restriction endonuclease McrA
MTERSRLWRAGATFEQAEGRRAAHRKYFAGLSAERREQRNTQERARYAQNRAAAMLTAAKRQRKHGVPVTITAADIWIPDNCPVCGVLLTVGCGASSDKSPSLDRYDPALGYVPGNIMVLCRGCNRRKQNHTGEQLIQLGQAVISAKAAYDARIRPLSVA